MGRKRFTSEQIITMLREAEVLLNLEIFDTLLEVRVLLERWRGEYNCNRPHSSLGYRPPAPEAFLAEKVSQGVVH